ncbi:MAG TPA: hypothetical protein VME46_10955 [Acidimicrobiales bacterium]|nr:hypothetical protein [Acidimicrobiales bacterium]
MRPAGRRQYAGREEPLPDADDLLHDAERAPRTEEGAPAERPQLYLVRRAPRRRRTRHLFVPAVIGALAAVSMGLVALHVLIAENQFKLDNLQDQANAAQSSYEHLRLGVAQLESPARIVSVAEGQLGMQQPASITYLPATSVAPAGGGAGIANPTSGGSVTGGAVTAPAGDADWPSIKPYLSGSP